MGYSIGVLNSIRHENTEEYQNRIPEATRENIASIGVALKQYPVLYNEFCDALINKIGKTILESKLFENRLARFKQGTVIDQKDVEEIFIEMSKSEGAYDPAGPNPLGRRNGPDVHALYHRQNRQDVYCISIGDIDFLRVFRSEATLDSFITRKIQSVYSGANYDEWLAMKNLLTTYDGYKVAMVGSMVPGGNCEGDPIRYAKNLVKTTRKLAMDMTFPSTKFNDAGVMTTSDPKKMVLLLNKDIVTEVDVELLAQAYNKGNTNIQLEIIPMDNFDGFDLKGYSAKGGTENGEAVGVAGLLVDEDWFRVFDTLFHFEPQRNAHGLFTNYFLHVHQILSASRFKNAVALLEYPGIPL